MWNRLVGLSRPFTERSEVHMGYYYTGSPRSPGTERREVLYIEPAKSGVRKCRQCQRYEGYCLLCTIRLINQREWYKWYKSYNIYGSLRSPVKNWNLDFNPFGSMMNTGILSFPSQQLVSFIFAVKHPVSSDPGSQACTRVDSSMFREAMRLDEIFGQTFQCLKVQSYFSSY